MSDMWAPSQWVASGVTGPNPLAGHDLATRHLVPPGAPGAYSPGILTTFRPDHIKRIHEWWNVATRDIMLFLLSETQRFGNSW